MMAFIQWKNPATGRLEKMRYVVEVEGRLALGNNPTRDRERAVKLSPQGVEILEALAKRRGYAITYIKDIDDHAREQAAAYDVPRETHAAFIRQAAELQELKEQGVF